MEELDFTGEIKPSNTHHVFGAPKIEDFQRKEKLLTVLKKEVSNISITDIMTAHAYLVDEGKYVQENYRKNI